MKYVIGWGGAEREHPKSHHGEVYRGLVYISQERLMKRFKSEYQDRQKKGVFLVAKKGSLVPPLARSVYSTVSTRSCLIQ